MIEQLTFLQRIVAITNVTRSFTVLEKRSSAQNICKMVQTKFRVISSSPRGSVLTKDMTLFDVVYLDIVHGFDVPNDVLLDYVDKGSVCSRFSFAGLQVVIVAIIKMDLGMHINERLCQFEFI